MPIKVQCPNPVCGQVITVKDEYAGKRGKCPACGSAMMIPSSGLGREAAPPRQAPRGDPFDFTPAESVSERATPDELRLPTADTAEAPAGPDEPPVRKAGPGLLAGYSIAELTTRLALVIGLAALVLISFVPQMRWLYISTAGRGREAEAQIDGIHLLVIGLTGGGVGTALLVYSALLAVLAVLCLAALERLPRETSDTLVAAVGSLAAGWGVTTLFWLTGFLIKAFITAGEHGTKDRTILPGFGLIFGFFASLAVIAVFGYLVASRRRFLALAAAGGLGFFFGLLLLLFNARPWQPWHLRGLF